MGSRCSRRTGRWRGGCTRPGWAAVVAWFLRALPTSPRCAVCAAPFGGVGRYIAGPLGYRPSRKNPTVCSVCVEFSPPGGMKMPTGVLFADLRGFTARFDGGDPAEASALLRRFYRCAEDVLFPDAVIDKLIGDEVMAIYLPALQPGMERGRRAGADARTRPRAAALGRLRQRRGAVRRDGHRPRRRRGLRGQHRAAGTVRLHGRRRRGEHRLTPPGRGGAAARS